MKINWITGCGTSMVYAVFKVYATGALLPTVVKCGLGKDSAFLIAFKPTTIIAVLFISGTSCTRCQRIVAQNVLSEIFNRLTVKPFHNTHSSYIVSAISVGVWLVSLLTTYTETSVPVYVKFIPRCVAKDFLVRHVWK